MRAPLLPVSRDRRISAFPLCYTPEACLQLREDFHAQVRAACQRRTPGTVGLKISKVVVVGDLCVGKTSLINRFCKEVFDRDYKATIGVDFEIERFEIAGVPYNLQIWDTAGQEKFKCIASAYYRGAEVIITVFDLADIQTLDHTKRWLEDALRENHPGSSFVFLVGTKKDLLVSLKKSISRTNPMPRVSGQSGTPSVWPMRCRQSIGPSRPKQGKMSRTFFSGWLPWPSRGLYSWSWRRAATGCCQSAQGTSSG